MATKVQQRTCPCRGCQRKRGFDQVMCRHHWYMVPDGLRKSIWRFNGTAKGSSGHLVAIRQAIEHVNELEQRLNPQGGLFDDCN